MKIGNHDVKDYGAKQLLVEFIPPQNGAGYEWPDGFLAPVNLETTQKCGKAKITLYFRGENRDEINKAISEFCGLLTEPQNVELDGYTGYFYGYLVAATPAKTTSPRRYKLDIELDGYRIEDDVTETAQAGMRIKRKGTRKAPCSVTIVSESDTGEVTLSGFGSEIVVRNLKAGVPVTISADGLVLENGKNKMGDVKMLEFPALVAEETALAWTPENVTVSVRYTPAWL